MILQIGLQILLPAFLLVGLWRGAFRNRPEWLLNVLAVSAALLFVFLTARWDFTSYYLRFVLPVLLAAAAYISYRRTNRLHGERRKLKLSAALTNAAVLLAFSGLSVIVLWGYAVPEGAIQLASPLRDGTYYITAVQISWAEQRRLLKTREKASPKGCSGDQVAALDKIEIMLLSQLGLHSRQ